LSSGVERYTSLSASADGRRLLLTIASPMRSLWRLSMDGPPSSHASPARIALTTTTGFSPRLGPDYLLYASASGTAESIWKFAKDAGPELWKGQGAHLRGAPAISSDGHSIAFIVQQQGKTSLYVMRDDGTNAHVLADSLKLQGSPAWAPDSKSITAAAEV